jgi:hypothetical protein
MVAAIGYRRSNRPHVDRSRRCHTSPADGRIGAERDDLRG